MRNDLIGGAARLAKGGIDRIAPARGRRVACLAGVLWITQDGDARDVILEAGDSFAFDRDGPAFVSALADARYLVLA